MNTHSSTRSSLFRGVLPALTTPFSADGRVDHNALARQIERQVAAGVDGLVALGSLGEGATLELSEKLAVLETCVNAAGGRVPVISAVSALSTQAALSIAGGAGELGCAGLMVLPPYVHAGPWSEMAAHMGAVFAQSQLPCMLYNNPAAYGLDILPDQIIELAQQFESLVAVKESSGDVRRITALRALCNERCDLQLCVGLDDAVVEGVAAGARGWVAGLVNALPVASVELYRLALRAAEGDATAKLRCDQLYAWFLPLLRWDTVPTFVQLIKLVQDVCACGDPTVRAPRAELASEEVQRRRAELHSILAQRPAWLANERALAEF